MRRFENGIFDFDFSFLVEHKEGLSGGREVGGRGVVGGVGQGEGKEVGWEGLGVGSGEGG
jgi:hypothetical protein